VKRKPPLIYPKIIDKNNICYTIVEELYYKEDTMVKIISLAGDIIGGAVLILIMVFLTLCVIVPVTLYRFAMDGVVLIKNKIKDKYDDRYGTF